MFVRLEVYKKEREKKLLHLHASEKLSKLGFEPRIYIY
jgi:hypothetical protein